MTEKSTFRKLAKERLADAIVLYKEGRYDGAQYICGYAIEFSLKYAICKTLKWEKYPPSKGGDKDSFRSFKTHDTQTLLQLSGRNKVVYNDTKLLSAWNSLKSWDSEIRYEIVSTNQKDIDDMLNSAIYIMNYLGVRCSR